MNRVPEMDVLVVVGRRVEDSTQLATVLARHCGFVIPEKVVPQRMMPSYVHQQFRGGSSAWAVDADVTTQPGESPKMKPPCSLPLLWPGIAAL